MHESSEIFETTELNEGNKTLRELTSFFRDLIIILLFVLFIRMFLITPFQINGSSMETSYHNGEYILVNKFSYLNLPVSYASNESSDSFLIQAEKFILSRLPVHVGDPVRGDVVVITPHADEKREYYIKRVIWLPGDTIKFESGEVYIQKASGSGEFIKLNEVYLSPSNKGNTRLDVDIHQNIFQIPLGYYWVMGDNRNNSADSRQCFQNCMGKSEPAHFIARKDIIGTVLLDFGYFNIIEDGGLLKNGKMSWTHPPRLLNHPKNATYPELN